MTSVTIYFSDADFMSERVQVSMRNKTSRKSNHSPIYPCAPVGIAFIFFFFIGQKCLSLSLAILGTEEMSVQIKRSLGFIFGREKENAQKKSRHFITGSKKHRIEKEVFNCPPK